MPGRVLIVDPNAQRRMLLKSLLLEGYYLVDVITAADDPMVPVRARYADLMFLACDSGDGSAQSTLKQLQSQSRSVGVPIVAIGAPGTDGRRCDRGHATGWRLARTRAVAGSAKTHSR